MGQLLCNCPLETHNEERTLAMTACDAVTHFKQNRDW